MSQKKLSNLVNGFMKKHRTLQDIDKDYQMQALSVGHKLEQIRDLEEQISMHQKTIVNLKTEMKAAEKARQEQVKKNPAPQPAPVAPQAEPAPEQVSQ